MFFCFYFIRGVRESGEGVGFFIGELLIFVNKYKVKIKYKYCYLENFIE